MKTIFYFMAALGLAANAGADPNRYEWRSFGGVNVGLQPVFSWWAFVTHATNQPMDITAMDTNKFAVVSNIWAHLPPRPLPEWFRILGEESSITVVGSMWKLDATIEPAPMMLRHETIYLENPPAREIRDFKIARASYLALMNQQNNDVQAVVDLKSNILTEANALLQTNPPGHTAPGAGATQAAPPPPNQVRAFQRDSLMTISNMNTAHARMQARDTQIAPLEQYLGTFPDKKVYWLDHFAKRTGRKVGGIEVYDLGMAAGLTY